MGTFFNFFCEINHQNNEMHLRQCYANLNLFSMNIPQKNDNCLSKSIAEDKIKVSSGYWCGPEFKLYLENIQRKKYKEKNHQSLHTKP